VVIKLNIKNIDDNMKYEDNNLIVY